jgi:hypothetical protein
VRNALCLPCSEIYNFHNQQMDRERERDGGGGHGEGTVI